MGSPSFALNVTHNIESHTELAKQLEQLFTSERSLEVLKSLLAERKFSIYSSYSDEYEQTNLFFLRCSRCITIWIIARDPGR